MRPAMFLAGAAAGVAGLALAVLVWPRTEGVTVYCATDEVHARPILEAFTRETGIAVRDVQFDTEAAKTVGLVTRLRAEKANPRCDVFWNNEVLHTLRLAEEGILEPYDSPSAADVPAQFKDPQHRWTGFAARARVLIVNTELVPEAERPRSMDDLAEPKWKGRAAFVKPLTGTTLTHAAVLYTVLGKERALAWFRSLHANDCRFPGGNAKVAAAVSLGQVAFGFTDTDDFRKVEQEGRPVAIVYPDQEPGKPGTLLIPNTVALVKGGPRPDLGRKLIDYLLGKDVEAWLAATDGAQIPVRPDVRRPPHVKAPPDFRPMEVDWSDVVAHFDERLRQLEALWP